MSVRLMSAVFKAEIPDIEIQQGSETRKVSTPTMKLLLLAWADHANDDGEGMYPSQTTLEKKTGLSHSTVNAAIIAAKQAGYVSYVGVSKRGTSEYKMDINALVSPRHYLSETSPAMKQTPVPSRDEGSATTGRESSLNIPQTPDKEILLKRIELLSHSVIDNNVKRHLFLSRLDEDCISLAGCESSIIVRGLAADAEVWTSRYYQSFANLGLELEFRE